MNYENPFQIPGPWYKGNLHTHTRNSDGRLTPEEAAESYAASGYHFLALTDHNALTRLDQQPGYPLLIPGEELGCEDGLAAYHIVALGIREEIQLPAKVRPQTVIDRIREQDGLAVLCHPYWLGQTVGDLIGLEGAVAVEVFNTTCEVGIGKGLSGVHWDDLLARGKRLTGLAVDDAHFHRDDYLGGWIMLKAPELSPAAIVQAVSAGRFYASQGPQIERLELEGGKAWVRCSPARSVYFMSDYWRGRCVQAPAGAQLTEAEASLPEGGRYLRIEVVDSAGRRAWTNPFFLSQ